MANRYPAIDLNLTCTAEEVQVGDNVQVDITLQRDIDGADVTPVVTSYYPVPKEEVTCCGLAPWHCWFDSHWCRAGGWSLATLQRTPCWLSRYSPRVPLPHLPPLTCSQRFSFGRSHKVSLSFAPTEAGQKT